MKPQDIVNEKSLWIFGYGSLVWKPDFKFKRSKIGYIQGYKRRFWHGDNFYRGDDLMPGRVVTLVEDGNWVEFVPRDDDQSPLIALVYIATADNPIYLGPASPEEIAAQISTCKGKTGDNIEYLLRLAQFMRLYCPGVEDDHLFSIEAAALALMPYVMGSYWSVPTP
ncbi:cation transport regulator-like protein 1-like [Scleropages formosus]|uniref:Gamma-glutamylcyclotransferase n=1 Tax=Scleropages formosus TaxID=113540 RepID=A0A0P7YD59_SCLFO|nr:cation transport regulator-like protein 1-like [Scleropages formosus]